MAEKQENPRLKRFACGEIVPGCEFTVTASTEEALLKQVAEHAHSHGFAEITPELAQKVKAAIK